MSCGHRVPRAPEFVDGRRLYWCETCGEYRMSGGSSTGERGFDFLLQLRDDIASHEIPIVVADPGTDRGRAIVAALGAVIDGKTVVTTARSSESAEEFYVAAIERLRRIEQGEGYQQGYPEHPRSPEIAARPVRR